MAKLSAREKWAKETGRPKEEYDGGSSKSKKGESVSDLVKSVLSATPAQQEILPDFETTYTPELEAEDYAQSEALYKPYFEQQIANELEDLNAWSESENVSYERSLRRARFSLGASGGAIGGEREQVEGEMNQDHTAKVQNQVRGVERNVGTEKVTGAGFQSGGQTQEGELVGQMKAAIQEGQLWYKNQRAQRYYGNANTYYSQPSPYSLSGDKL